MAELKPFLRWAGGKGQLINDLASKVPSKESNIKIYCEPFLGSGAFFLRLLSSNQFDYYIINDINHKLINAWQNVKQYHTELIRTLAKLQLVYNNSTDTQKEDFYYKIRDLYNDTRCRVSDSASSFIFLNKTCFNGLYRENRNGKLNAAFGYKNNITFDFDNIRNISKVLNTKDANGLNKVTIISKDFRVTEILPANTFVYFDPPYRPISLNSFKSYNSSGFNDTHQIELKKLCDKLDHKGTQWLLSNSDMKNADKNDNFFDDLYKDYEIKRAHARRSISSDVDESCYVTELLINNSKTVINGKTLRKEA